MLIVIQNTDDDSLAEFISKRVTSLTRVTDSGRTIEVEMDKDESEDFEDSLEHGGFVVLDRQEDDSPEDRKGIMAPLRQGSAARKSESSTRRSPYESLWRHPRDPWG